MTAPAPIIAPPPSQPSTDTGIPPAEGTGRYEANPLRLQRVPSESWEVALPVIVRNFERIEAHLRPQGGGSIGLGTMAQTFGWCHCKGAVAMATDTQFAHNLGRIPTKIAHYTDLDGQGNAVQGQANGGGPNTTPWTATHIYVRARDADGNFEFMVT